MPPTKSILLNEHTESSITETPPSPVHTTLIPQIKRFTKESLENHKKFSDRDFQYAEQNKVEINLFKRKHRHAEDLDETLSVISQRSTKSYSRLDRVVQKIPATQELLEPTQEVSFSTQDRIHIQKELDAMEGIEATQEFLQPETQESSVKLPTQESSFKLPTQESSFKLQTHEPLFESTQEPSSLPRPTTPEANILPNQENVNTQKTEEEKKRESEDIKSVHSNTSSLPQIPLMPDDDDIDYGMDYGMDYGIEDMDEGQQQQQQQEDFDDNIDIGFEEFE